ncbi:hypothetical protein ACFLIM_26135 [Nonomuraea sp. M3C6]|uniref:Non-reducing end beta-L-arabinofuranosidase-like GH127 C-terminal domain-containing protein n=1 Tax=Nonomuraea marmarensis TaxID=3351344 RepID=A0ABW7AK79_9ACTN
MADEPPLAEVAVRRSAPVERVEDGVVELDVEAALVRGKPRGWPYGAEKDSRVAEAITLRLVPYHRWGNRGPATMRVWLRS